VGAQDDEIVQILVRKPDFALHLVVHDRLAFERRLYPHRRLDAGRCLGWVTMAPGTIVTRRATFGTRTLAHLGEFFRCSITVIRFALLDQFLGDLAMALGTGELRHGLAVPGEAEPGKAVQNGRRGRFRRALAV